MEVTYATKYVNNKANDYFSPERTSKVPEECHNSLSLQQNKAASS
jgi:hypothetical protein